LKDAANTNYTSTDNLSSFVEVTSHKIRDEMKKTKR